jgi:Flp pilus assembly protein TadG
MEVRYAYGLFSSEISEFWIPPPAILGKEFSRNRMGKSNRRGFTLIATALCITSLLGMLGLAVDLGRVYIAKNETQSFADTAALAAAMALNGVNFIAAQDAVAGNTKNLWNMGTTSFGSADSAVTTEFAKALPANAFRPNPETWSTTPPSAAGYMFVRVTASAAVQLYLLPAVGTSNAQLVKAASVAGQVPLTSFNSGLLPFSPIQHVGAVASDPPFGMVVGSWYTLRYPGAAPFASSDLCPGDQGDSTFLTAANRQTPDERGFYQNPQESLAAAQVVDGVMKFPVVFPGKITMSGGAMDAALIALNKRIDFDTDHVSTTYAQYQSNIFNGKRVGNGFRLAGAPVNAGPVGGGGARDIVGFGGFFLSASSTNVYYSAGDRTAWCAEYYGVWNKSGQGAGPGTPGVAYTSVLVQ